MTKRKKARRPKWAANLSAYWWKHLQEGQRRNVPTLPNLKQDATTCPDCKHILTLVEGAK